MITFRFYLVTLVAVFLAVALGVVIGSTFTEPALIENLQGRIESVRDNLDARVATISELNGEIDELAAYLDDSAPWAVDSQLSGTEMIIVADEGVDSGAVEDLVTRAREAGAAVEGIVWIQPSFGLGEESDLEALTDALGPLGRDPVEAGAAAWELLMVPAGEATPPAGVPQSSTTTAVQGSEEGAAVVADEPGAVLAGESAKALAEAGFVEIQIIDASAPFETSESNPDLPLVVVLVTGQASEIPGGAESMAARAVGQAALAIPTVVAEVFGDVGDKDDPSNRGETVAPVIEDGDLASLSFVSTVDDLDLLQGRVATILAASDLGRSITGNYGYGEAAERVLPEWFEQAP